MGKLRTIIVDDEPLAVKFLRAMLSDIEEIEIVEECCNGREAVKAAAALNPDLIFLDIQMPGMNGFDVLEHLDSNVNVIFVTAFDEYALRAFEVNALDYLLKPVSNDRLQQSIERLELVPDEAEDDLRELEYHDRLLLKLDTHLGFLKISTIVCITSAGDYSEVLCTNKKKVLVHKSMAEWETRLPDAFFNRIHRTTIVNMEFVDRLEEWFNNSYRVYMKGIEEPYVMSRRYVTKLKQKLS